MNFRRAGQRLKGELRNPWTWLAIVLFGALAVDYPSTRSTDRDSIDRSVDKRKEAPRRFAHPGAVWDLDVGPSFPRRDVLGKGPSRRSGPAHEAVDLLTGNLSQEYPGG